MGNNQNNLNKLILHPDIKKVVEEINRANIILSGPIPESFNFENFALSDSTQISCIEDLSKVVLNPEKGQEFISSGNKIICGYDESKDKFQALPGIAYGTSHSLVIMADKEYIPSNFITFRFYTKSKVLSSEGAYIRYVQEDVESEVNKDYHRDRNNFILNQVPLPNNSILLIDGPLIGGQATSYVNELNKGLLERGILPLFFVKNSGSDMVINHLVELKGKYHSDIHWADQLLNKGERTALFKYTDSYSREKSKIFCYIKAFTNCSPQRIEFHPDTYKKYADIISSIFNLIYYLLIAQGNDNPQVRPIAIAEAYARATLRSVKFQSNMEKLNITPTMNQARGLDMS